MTTTTRTAPTARPSQLTRTDIVTIPTATLWDNAHQALLQGAWGAARALLDDLMRRGDVVDKLPALEAYAPRTEGEIDHGYRAILQDRIDQVNAHVDAARE